MSIATKKQKREYDIITDSKPPVNKTIFYRIYEIYKNIDINSSSSGVLTISDLPKDILVYISKYINQIDLESLFMTSKRNSSKIYIFFSENMTIKPKKIPCFQNYPLFQRMIINNKCKIPNNKYIEFFLRPEYQIISPYCKHLEVIQNDSIPKLPPALTSLKITFIRNPSSKSIDLTNQKELTYLYTDCKFRFDITLPESLQFIEFNGLISVPDNTVIPKKVKKMILNRSGLSNIFYGDVEDITLPLINPLDCIFTQNIKSLKTIMCDTTNIISIPNLIVLKETNIEKLIIISGKIDCKYLPYKKLRCLKAIESRLIGNTESYFESVKNTLLSMDVEIEKLPISFSTLTQFTSLNLRRRFIGGLENLPKSIKNLHIKSTFNGSISNLPDGITDLRIFSPVKKIENLPKSLEILMLHQCPDGNLNFNSNIKLFVEYSYNSIGKLIRLETIFYPNGSIYHEKRSTRTKIKKENSMLFDN